MPFSRKHSLFGISRHTTKKDCWLIIHGKVYDVTTVLDDHPGGGYVLLQASGGGDATEAFEEVGHSTAASTMMEGYLIGTVRGDEGAAADGGAPKATGAVTAMAQRTSPSSFSFSDLLLPALVLSLALGVWYYLNFNSKSHAWRNKSGGAGDKKGRDRTEICPRERSMLRGSKHLWCI